MKYLKLITLSCLLTIMPIQNSRAAVAGIAAIAGAPAASGIALAGLGSLGFGVLGTLSASTCDHGHCNIVLAFFGVIGLVLLDSDTANFEFVEIDHDKASEFGLSYEEVEIYNTEVEEVNIVFSEVKASLGADSTVEDARKLWEENKNLLSDETFKVLTVLASQK
ncbi:hypothetical protein [Bacteriovorax sp. Seq25_V]|uniref:hypothetical protein n=1 Tax=Bacteriovorax sp. Seq25_V TaxID=1201288 RepID=UPI000389ECFD|nr:hypothetical protein [Bacteriovorax sp. Seq25_V]EQC47755.1 hypothetical protein M900_A0179 [Bacteriovorax sp. Seq25_V]